MSTPEPHTEQHENQPAQRRGLSTDMIVMLTVVALLVIAFAVGGLF